MTDTKTLTFTRMFPATPPQVVHALTDPEARMTWGPPDADNVVLIEGQPTPTPGSRDTSRVGPRDNPYVDATTDWIEISPSRVSYAETLSAEGDSLGTSLAIFELSASAAGTQVQTTILIASFVGDGMIDEYDSGWTHAIDALARHLEGTAD